MRRFLRFSWVVVFLVPILGAAQPVATRVSDDPMPRDQIAIYTDFLKHYSGPISNLLNMQPTTVPFVVKMWLPEQAPVVQECLAKSNLPATGGDTVHVLPAEILKFGTTDSVIRRIQASGKLIPPSKRRPGVGPDGFSLDKFTFSEVVFDKEHLHAAFSYSADCGCLGGQGGIVVYALKGGKWVRAEDCDSWQG